MERRVPVAILTDAILFMAGIDKELLAKACLLASDLLLVRTNGDRRRKAGKATYGNFQQAELSGEVQRGIAVVVKIGALETAWVVLDDALQQYEIPQLDRSANSNGNVNCHFEH